MPPPLSEAEKGNYLRLIRLMAVLKVPLALKLNDALDAAKGRLDTAARDIETIEKAIPAPGEVEAHRKKLLKAEAAHRAAQKEHDDVIADQRFSDLIDGIVGDILVEPRRARPDAVNATIYIAFRLFPTGLDNEYRPIMSISQLAEEFPGLGDLSALLEPALHRNAAVIIANPEEPLRVNRVKRLVLDARAQKHESLEGLSEPDMARAIKAIRESTIFDIEAATAGEALRDRVRSVGFFLGEPEVFPGFDELIEPPTTLTQDALERRMEAATSLDKMKALLRDYAASVGVSFTRLPKELQTEMATAVLEAKGAAELRGLDPDQVIAVALDALRSAVEDAPGQHVTFVSRKEQELFRDEATLGKAVQLMLKNAGLPVPEALSPAQKKVYARIVAEMELAASKALRSVATEVGQPDLQSQFVQTRILAQIPFLEAQLAAAREGERRVERAGQVAEGAEAQREAEEGRVAAERERVEQVALIRSEAGAVGIAREAFFQLNYTDQQGNPVSFDNLGPALQNEVVRFITENAEAQDLDQMLRAFLSETGFQQKVFRELRPDLFDAARVPSELELTTQLADVRETLVADVPLERPAEAAFMAAQAGRIQRQQRIGVEVAERVTGFAAAQAAGLTLRRVLKEAPTAPSAAELAGEVLPPLPGERPTLGLAPVGQLRTLTGPRVPIAAELAERQVGFLREQFRGSLAGRREAEFLTKQEEAKAQTLRLKRLGKRKPRIVSPLLGGRR